MPKDLQILTLNNGVLSAGFNSSTKYTDGTAKLVQRVVKCLLTAQGDILLEQDFGASLNTRLPKTYDDRDMGKVQTLVIESILIAEKQIKEDDAIGSDREDGKLLSLSFKNLYYNVNNTEWVVEMSLVTKNGISVNFSAGIQL